MAPSRKPFEPELIDSLCHDAVELLIALSLALREEDDGKRAGSVTEPKNSSRPKPPEKKAVIYFDVTRTKRDHVAHSGGMLIMLSEEDGRMLSLSAGDGVGTRILSSSSPLPAVFFSQIPGRKKTRGTRSVGRSPIAVRED